MTSNIVGTDTPVHYSLISGDILPKGNENKPITTTEMSKTDEVGEDDVFANENETARGDANFQKDPETNADHNKTSATVNVDVVNQLTSVVSSIPVAVSQQEDVSTTSSPSNTAVSVPTTTRRPSYTSKAPSALTNLPKTIDEINSSPSGLQSFGLHNVDLLDKRGSASAFDNEEHLRSANKDLLSLHGQASFESIDHDEYSNPGTPTSNSMGSPGQNTGKSRDKSRMRADVLSRARWEMAAKQNVLSVRCREQVAELHKLKFGSGSKGKCIKVGDRYCTPIEFEAMAGRASCKDWKRSIRFHGQHLQKLIEDQYLTLHAISCTCGICCGDDTLTGPVKLFQSVKRKRSHINSTLGSSPGPYKRKSFSEDYRSFRERGPSLSVDSDVFSIGQEDGGMPPMTPLTPITPLTPHTPFGANCLTPLPVGVARPNSPPKSIMLQVPVSQPTMASISIPMKEVLQQQQHHLQQQQQHLHQQQQHLQQQQQQQHQHVMPPPTPTKLQSSTDLNTLTHQPWIQLEEMASSLVIMANKLKLMIDQAKIQSEAIKDSAVTQAKIQAENEKAEILRRTQIQHSTTMQIIPVGPNGEQLPQTHFTVQVPKVCQNCGREALLECTGCNKSYYCGQFCQQKDWIVHKNKCRNDILNADEQQQHHQHQYQQLSAHNTNNNNHLTVTDTK